MAKTKEEKLNTVERYATGLFYASHPDPTPRSHYASGISSPINGAPRPICKVQPSNPGQRHDAARHDHVVFSCELNKTRNGSTHDNDALGRHASSGSSGGSIVARSPRNAAPPLYSAELLNSLDALLNG